MVLLHNDIQSRNAYILERFAKVFEQTYTRFLDLQKAEAQAREAQIEPATGKGAGKNHGDAYSEELHEVIKTLFTRN